ncbi:shikimate dehydrogenase [Candidatus Peregrinibacteria bacterium]|nr:shikimate dehydrogenase [Candidatus Peregrinibacteria bacterium]
MTEEYGILAYPAKHSLSPLVYSSTFKSLGIDARYSFFEIKDTDFDSFMKNLKESGIRGLSVSLPYKEAVIKYLDEIDEDAEKIGAVNTIVKKGKKLFGYNTDFFGSNEAIKEVFGDLKKVNAVVLGAGGAAKGIVYGLLKEGAKVSAILNRTKEKSYALAEKFSKMFDVKIGTDMGKIKFENNMILIHATSTWTLGENKISSEISEFLSDDLLRNFYAVMEASYNPLITPLVLKTRELGLKTIAGDRMFLYQAKKQFELWTGKKFPFEFAEKILHKALSGVRSQSSLTAKS